MSAVCPACASPRWYGTKLRNPLRMYWRGDVPPPWADAGRRVFTTVSECWVEWQCAQCGHKAREEQPNDESTF